MPLAIDFNLYLSFDHIHRSSITVGDLRQFITTLDSFNVSDDAELDECNLMFSLEIPYSSIETITCGDCSPQSIAYNTVIATHNCSDS